MIIFLSILIIALSALALAWPFLQKGADAFMPFAEIQGSGRKELREYKGRLLLALKELDFDYETAKLSKEDYIALREKYQKETVKIMKELEKTESNWKDLEKYVSENLPQPSEPAATPSKEMPTGGKKFCSSCGNPLSLQDRFCGSCGNSVRESKIA